MTQEITLLPAVSLPEVTTVTIPLIDQLIQALGVPREILATLGPADRMRAG